jgi:hypothetical protein
MAVKILPAQIRNLQQIEAVVAGPDDVNRLFIIDGQFDCQMSAFPPGAAAESQKETFTVLAGPVFTRKQFAQANGTASFTKTGFNTSAAAWQILGVDADWDDESGQVEVRIEAEVDCSGATKSASINGFAFHVTILAAVAGA